MWMIINTRIVQMYGGIQMFSQEMHSDHPHDSGAFV